MIKQLKSIRIGGNKGCSALKFQITNPKLQTIPKLQIRNYKKKAIKAKRHPIANLFGILVIVIWNLFVICLL
jgi:hypothetical protein